MNILQSGEENTHIPTCGLKLKTCGLKSFPVTDFDPSP